MDDHEPSEADLETMLARLRRVDATAGCIKQTFLPMELRGELSVDTSAALADKLCALRSERDALARAIRNAASRRGRSIRRRSVRQLEGQIAEVLDLSPDLRRVVECNLEV